MGSIWAVNDDHCCAHSRTRAGLLPISAVALLLAAFIALATAGPASGATFTESATVGSPHLEGGPQVDHITGSVIGGKVVLINQTGPLAFVSSYETDPSEPARTPPCREMTSQKLICEPAMFQKHRITRRSPAVIIIDELGPGDVFDAGKKGCDSEPIALYSVWNYAKGTAKNPAVIWGSAYDDALIGTGRAILHGCGGNDTLEIKAAHSRAYGEAGADIFHVSASRSRAYGGSERDSFVFSGFSKGTAVYGGGGKDSFEDKGKGRQRNYGGPGADWMLSGAGRDLLAGGGGDDELYAQFKNRWHAPYTTMIPIGADQLRCGPGHDTAYAGRRSSLSGCEQINWLPKTKPLA